MSLVPKQELMKSLAERTDLYSEQLKESDQHLTYLQSRGLTLEDMVSFRLGAVLDPLSIDESYWNRISFPYITPSGVVAIRFRRFPDDPDRPKFLEMDGAISRIYNVKSLFRQDDKIYVCEGETDTITAERCGLASIGIGGAHKWTGIFGRVLRNRDVVVLADNDDKGDGAKLAKEIYKTLGGCEIVRMPKGYDVSSLVADKGEQALLELVGRDDERRSRSDNGDHPPW